MSVDDLIRTDSSAESDQPFFYSTDRLRRRYNRQKSENGLLTPPMDTISNLAKKDLDKDLKDIFKKYPSDNFDTTQPLPRRPVSAKPLVFGSQLQVENIVNNLSRENHTLRKENEDLRDQLERVKRVFKAEKAEWEDHIKSLEFELDRMKRLRLAEARAREDKVREERVQEHKPQVAVSEVKSEFQEILEAIRALPQALRDNVVEGSAPAQQSASPQPSVVPQPPSPQAVQSSPQSSSSPESSYAQNARFDRLEQIVSSIKDDLKNVKTTEAPAPVEFKWPENVPLVLNIDNAIDKIIDCLGDHQYAHEIRTGTPKHQPFTPRRDSPISDKAPSMTSSSSVSDESTSIGESTQIEIQQIPEMLHQLQLENPDLYKRVHEHIESREMSDQLRHFIAQELNRH